MCDCDRRLTPAQTVLAANTSTETLPDSRSGYNGFALHQKWKQACDSVSRYVHKVAYGIPCTRPEVSENRKVALQRNCATIWSP